MKKRIFFVCVILLVGVTLAMVFKSRKPMNAEEGNSLKHVLVMGTDRVSKAADTISLLSFEDNPRQITVLQIPRDLYLRMPDGERKINSLLPDQGGEAAVSILERLLDVSIDGYVIVSPEAAEAAVDALGGIPFSVPFEMRYEDPAQELFIHIPEGNTVLCGSDFLAAWRYRSGYRDGDLGRLAMQRRLLGAALERLASAKSIGALWRVYRQISENVLTNLSKSDIISLCLPFCSGGCADIRFFTLPGDAIYKDGVSYFVMCRPATERLMRRVKGDLALVDRDFLGLGSGEAMENVYFDPNLSALEDANRESDR